MAGTHPVIREVKKEGDENEEKTVKRQRMMKATRRKRLMKTTTSNRKKFTLTRISPSHTASRC